jgi:hypothetical protein
LELEGLPHWPRFLNLGQAAAYVGVSPNVFLQEVKTRLWPEPMRRGSKLALVTWDKNLLDLAADQRIGVVTGSQLTFSNPQPNAAVGRGAELPNREGVGGSVAADPPSPAEDAAERQRRLHAAFPQKRAERRAQKTR